MKSEPWDSLSLLKGLNRESIDLSPAAAADLEHAFWIELATEYDAENFCKHLDYLRRVGRLKSSEMFMAFERLWRRDELNHTRGFARIYSVLYSVPEEELFLKLRSRMPDFSAVEPYLLDEFTICALLAYDESATAKAYGHDLRNRYPALGNQALVGWIRKVARDEAWHFENVLGIIKSNYRERLTELPEFLNRLVDLDQTNEPYGATFVMDHRANHYDRALVESCRALILRRVGRCSLRS